MPSTLNPGKKDLAIVIHPFRGLIIVIVSTWGCPWRQYRNCNKCKCSSLSIYGAQMFISCNSYSVGSVSCFCIQMKVPVLTYKLLNGPSAWVFEEPPCRPLRICLTLTLIPVTSVAWSIRKSNKLQLTGYLLLIGLFPTAWQSLTLYIPQCAINILNCHTFGSSSSQDLMCHLLTVKQPLVV